MVPSLSSFAKTVRPFCQFFREKAGEDRSLRFVSLFCLVVFFGILVSCAIERSEDSTSFSQVFCKKLS